MNYGEELAYWYLRFNGFFPLTNFVIHRPDARLYRSDCDILAVRHPYVSEPIGGAPEDWDEELQSRFDFSKTLGVITEVKTGDVDDNVFRNENVDYAVDRLGFASETNEIKEELHRSATSTINQGCQIGKLLISNHYPDHIHCRFISLIHARSFIKQRITNYVQIKYADRLLFKSTLLQGIIWEVKFSESGTF